MEESKLQQPVAVQLAEAVGAVAAASTTGGEHHYTPVH